MFIILIISLLLTTSHTINSEYHKELCYHKKTVSKDGFLFVNEKSGEPFHPTYPNRVMKKVDKKCGIHVHPHMLRHYFATNAKDQNLPDMSVMRWLGQANIQMTNSYTRPNETSLLIVYGGVQDNSGGTK